MTELSQIELLAPAGGRSQLEAAVRFGADAVYLACDRFGMRQRAENFALEDIAGAVAFAHDAGVKVHVTVNTMMSQGDLGQLPEYLEALDDAGADALIIGDMGAFSLAGKHAPHVQRHVSTQASVMNAAAARAWYDLGASRVVLAREMSVEDIADLRAAVPRELELETFVHGAMCMAYSGRCLLSAAMTGRSGNKGFCAQPCRWSYALVEEKRPGSYYPIEQDVRGTYVMNAYDLCMIEHLNDLAAAGVDSFKIEGRNKRAFYVATVVHAYRAVMDGADPADVMSDLHAISHRPYGTGFFYGEPKQRQERDGYDKEYLHAATVVSCEPVGSRAAGEGIASVDAIAGGIIPAKTAGSDAPVNVVDPAESADAAELSSSLPQTYRIHATCHNRFFEGDEVEALAPRKPISKLQVKNLVWEQRPSPEGLAPAPVAVPVANRTMETYAFESSVPLAPGDLLRIKIAQ
jgi:U32 family peptidase